MEGRLLACDMLDEFDAADSGDGEALSVLHFEAEYRDDGEPQKPLVLHYLKIVQARDDPAYTSGFANVLTEVLALVQLSTLTCGYGEYFRDLALSEPPQFTHYKPERKAANG